MPVMQQLPIPCPDHLIPVATDSFDAAYRTAKAQRAVFVGIEREGERWTVKADALTAGPYGDLGPLRRAVPSADVNE
jgi:hypothetical protein